MSRDFLEQFTQAYRQQTEQDSAEATERERATTRRRLLESLGHKGSERVGDSAAQLVANPTVVQLAANSAVAKRAAAKEALSASKVIPLRAYTDVSPAVVSESTGSVVEEAPEPVDWAERYEPTAGLSELGTLQNSGEPGPIDLDPLASPVRRRAAGASLGRRALVWTIPLAAILIGGAAFAAAGGSLAEVQQWVAEVFAPEQPSAPSVAKRRAKKSAPPAPAEAMPTASAQPAAEVPVVEVPVVEEPPEVAELISPEAPLLAPVGSGSKTRAKKPRAKPRKELAEVVETPPSTVTSPVETPSPTLEEDATLPAYRRAHRLHFQARNYSQALGAWTEYLRTAPRGRFATEARYNRALCYVRLGQRAAARRELRPFAEGRYAGYRQQEALKLVDRLK